MNVHELPMIIFTICKASFYCLFSRFQKDHRILPVALCYVEKFQILALE